MKNRLLEDLEQIRKYDDYGTVELKEKLLHTLFPSSMEELTLDLSHVTSVFYGLLLKNIGQEIGLDKIDGVSKNTFYDLGKAKSIQCEAKMESLPKDTRTFFIVLTSAIFNASPEYSFKVITYSREKTVFELYGVDRYLRILRELGIADYITFPTLVPFMNGIKDYFNIGCEITYDLETEQETNRVKHHYEFTMGS